MTSEEIQAKAIETARARSHAAVELRHVLWALLECLGDAAPSDIDRAAAAKLLEPAGSSKGEPPITLDARGSLGQVGTTEAAVVEARRLARMLRCGGFGGPAADAPGTGGSAQATATEAQTESAGPGGAEGQKPGDTAAILAELDGLIGLAPVKVAVRQLIATQRFNVERAKAGLPRVGENRHLVFTGNPGTGKTTVARLIARLYGSLGILSKGHLVETGRAELVAGYVGQTALKVRDVVMSAKGGVLLIDEAYALAASDRVDFGNEAVATLVKLMEDLRDDLVVIAAGYRDEMGVFIDSNPGLRSRFTQYVDFPDYSPDELLAIFQGMASKACVKLEAGVDASFLALVEKAKGPNFGNGRFVRSTFEAAYANLASRAFADGVIEVNELDLMIAADLPAPDPTIGAVHRPIGFGRAMAPEPPRQAGG